MSNVWYGSYQRRGAIKRLYELKCGCRLRTIYCDDTIYEIKVAVLTL